MKLSTKWKLGLLFLGGIILTGCTQSFATIQDKANVLATYEQTTVVQSEKTKTNLEVIIDTVNETGTYKAPTEKFFTYIEENVVERVKHEYGHHTITYGDQTKKYDELTNDDLLNNQEIRAVFIKTNEYSLVKYAKENATSLDELWSNYDKWVETAVDKGLKLSDVGSTYYHTYMKQQFETHLATVTAYITPVDGNFEGLELEGKTWGQAFEYGLIEGLLVWPISTLLYYLSQAFSVMGAFGTILAILIVTVVVRGLLLLLTFKQTASQQRMTELQPELDKLQQKYPNSNTNEYERNALSQEQMALYKKHNINPLGSLVVMIFQFPIFIAVWGAMSGSAVLRTGDLFGLQLSAATGQSIINWTGVPSLVALIIFIIMALAQATSMLLPQYLQKKRAKKVAKTKKNPAADQTASSMKMMNYVMLVMIVVMGFSLPVAMAIYWIISAIISLTQSLIMSSINNKKKEKDNYTKYKTVK